MQELTKREQEVFDYVVQFRKNKRFSPSMRQIALGVGLASVSTVHHHVHSITQKGWFLPYTGAPGSIIPTSE